MMDSSNFPKLQIYVMSKNMNKNNFFFGFGNYTKQSLTMDKPRCSVVVDNGTAESKQKEERTT